MNSLLIILRPLSFTTILIGFSLLAACLPNSAQGNEQIVSETPSEPSSNPCLELALDVAPEINQGDILPLRLELTNICDLPVELALGGRPAHDFSITDDQSIEIWRWAHDITIQTILDLKTLQPGETLSFEIEWPLVDNEGKVIAQGIYQVQGFLNGDPPQVLTTKLLPVTVLP